MAVLGASKRSMDSITSKEEDNGAAKAADKPAPAPAEQPAEAVSNSAPAPAAPVECAPVSLRLN